MSYLKNKVEYTDYDVLRSKSKRDWNSSTIPDDIKDKIIMDKDLFFAMLLHISSQAADKEKKDLSQLSFADICNYLYNKTNLSDVISFIRFYNTDEK